MKRLLSIQIAWAFMIVAFAFVLVILLGGCTTMTDKWLFNNPPASDPVIQE